MMPGCSHVFKHLCHVKVGIPTEVFRMSSSQRFRGRRSPSKRHRLSLNTNNRVNISWRIVKNRRESCARWAGRRLVVGFLGGIELGGVLMRAPGTIRRVVVAIVGRVQARPLLLLISRKACYGAPGIIKVLMFRANEVQVFWQELWGIFRIAQLRRHLPFEIPRIIASIISPFERRRRRGCSGPFLPKSVPPSISITKVPRGSAQIFPYRRETM